MLSTMVMFWLLFMHHWNKIVYSKSYIYSVNLYTICLIVLCLMYVCIYLWDDLKENVQCDDIKRHWCQQGPDSYKHVYQYLICNTLFSCSADLYASVTTKGHSWSLYGLYNLLPFFVHKLIWHTIFCIISAVKSPKHFLFCLNVKMHIKGPCDIEGIGVSLFICLSVCRS